MIAAFCYCIHLRTSSSTFRTMKEVLILDRHPRPKTDRERERLYAVLIELYQMRLEKTQHIHCVGYYHGLGNP